MKVYLAAFETQFRSYQVKVDPTQNLFLTYWYLPQTEEALRYLKPNGHRGLLTIDSGAHSFFELMGISVTAKAQAAKEVPDPHKYFSDYLAWAKEYAPLFDFFCELDLQELVGQEVVDEWRARVNEAGLGHKLITVWHSANSWADYERLLDTTKSRYIALEGIRPGQPMIAYNRFLKEAYKRQIRVHGFAFTRTELLRQFPFWSVDSSSWTASIRYGKLHFWDGKTLRVIDPKLAHFAKYNIPVALHSSMRSKDASKAKLEFSAVQFQKMQTFFTRYWEGRGIRWQD